MPAPRPIVDTQPDKKNKHAPEPAPVTQPGDLTNVATLPGGLVGATGNGSIGAQAARLGDTRLQSIQRRAIAARIGDRQGNRHLQRIVTSLKREELTTVEPSNGTHGNELEPATRTFADAISPGQVNHHRVREIALLQRAEEGTKPQAQLSFWERAKKKAFETALGAAGVDKEQVLGLIDKAGGAIAEIFKNPGRFVNTLIKAIGQGFTQFKDNIGKHLQAGLMGWLFGTMTRAGIELPKDFSLKSILTLVLQVLGITVNAIRQKVAKLIGEKNVMRLEKAWQILSKFMQEGIGGLWEMLKDYLADLKEMVIGEIKTWLISKIIQAAVIKILSMFNPVSGLITIIKTIYNVVKFLIERASQIAALFKAIAGSVVELAKGNVAEAANKVEQSLARLIPIAIGFLASLLGIGGIADKVKDIIKRIQTKVDQAIDKVVAKVVGGIKKLFGKGGKKEGEKKESKGVLGKVKQELTGQLNKPVANAGELQPIITSVYNKFKPEGLKYMNVVESSGRPGGLSILASASPETKVATISTVLGIEVGDLLPLVSKSGFGKTTLIAKMSVGDRTWDLGKFENTREEDLHKLDRHAEKQLLELLANDWTDFAKRDRKNQIEINVTRSPCADCTLVLNQFVDRKRAKGYDVTMTIKAPSLYGGVKKDKEGKPTPIWEGTRIALQDLHKPGMRIEPWDIFALLEEKGVKIDPKEMSPAKQEVLKRRIAEVKTVLDGIEKVKAGK